MERGRWEDQNFQLKEVQRLEEEDTFYEGLGSIYCGGDKDSVHTLLPVEMSTFYTFQYDKIRISVRIVSRAVSAEKEIVFATKSESAS
jgi:hypothetical protein